MKSKGQKNTWKPVGNSDCAPPAYIDFYRNLVLKKTPLVENSCEVHQSTTSTQQFQTQRASVFRRVGILLVSVLLIIALLSAAVGAYIFVNSNNSKISSNNYLRNKDQRDNYPSTLMRDIPQSAITTEFSNSRIEYPTEAPSSSPPSYAPMVIITGSPTSKEPESLFTMGLFEDLKPKGPRDFEMDERSPDITINRHSKLSRVEESKILFPEKHQDHEYQYQGHQENESHHDNHHHHHQAGNHSAHAHKNMSHHRIETRYGHTNRSQLFDMMVTQRLNYHKTHINDSTKDALYLHYLHTHVHHQYHHAITEEHIDSKLKAASHQFNKSESSSSNHTIQTQIVHRRKPPVTLPVHETFPSSSHAAQRYQHGQVDVSHTIIG